MTALPSTTAALVVPGFDLLRLIAAVLVLVQHSYALTGAWEGEWMVRLSGQQLSCGMVGVGLFFVISGYLVEQSRERQPDLLNFLRARALRIFPALMLVVLVAALIFGPLWTTLSLRDYFSDSQTWWYLLNVKLFPMQDSLPGVFKENFIRNAVNGSLWTLPYEVMCYVALFVTATLLGRYRAEAFLISAAACYLLWLMLDAATAVPGQRHPLLLGVWGVNTKDFAAFGSMFFAGSALAAGRHTLAHPAWACTAAAALVAAIALGVARQAMPILLPILGISIAHLAGSAFRLRERIGDLSYGVYLWAFPLQQWLVMPNGPQVRQPEWHLLVSLLLVLPLAWLSWHRIERPILKLKRRT